MRVGSKGIAAETPTSYVRVRYIGSFNILLTRAKIRVVQPEGKLQCIRHEDNILELCTYEGTNVTAWVIFSVLLPQNIKEN